MRESSQLACTVRTKPRQWQGSKLCNTFRPLLATVSSTCLIGSCLAELFYDRGNSYEFTSLVRELEGPGSVNDVKEFPFQFEGVEKKFESYSGINVRLR